MRLHLYALALALCAAPLAAQQPAAQQERSTIRLPVQQPAAPQGTAPARQAPRGLDMTIPPEFSDPRLAGRLVDVLKVMSNAFLDLPVGEAQAAMEGRKPTAAEKRQTVRSETGMNERQLGQQLEASRPMMEASMKALVSALPAMMKGMSEAGRELERATTNIPRPDYPKR